MSEWQPIKTAPRDATEVLLYVPVFHEDSPGKAYSLMAVAFYEQGGWQVYTGDNAFTYLEIDCDPTHWMPLPSKP